MSVVGLVPPVPIDGQLYIDGAFSANLPVFPAQALGAETIFAFDVSRHADWTSTRIRDHMSGFEIIIIMIWQFIAGLFGMTAEEKSMCHWSATYLIRLCTPRTRMS